MAKEIFDQQRPRSAMARRLDEAFDGCEEWTLAPPAPRRRLDIAPWLSRPAQDIGGAPRRIDRGASEMPPESRAA